MAPPEDDAYVLRLRLGTLAIATLTPCFWAVRAVSTSAAAGSPAIWLAIILGALATAGFTFLPAARRWGRHVFIAAGVSMMIVQVWLLAEQGFGVEFALAPTIIFFAICAIAVTRVEIVAFVTTSVVAPAALLLAYDGDAAHSPLVTPLVLCGASIGGSIVTWLRLRSHALLTLEITRRQAVEALLRKAQEQLESIFDATSDGLLGIHYTSEGPRITYANRRFGEIFGLDPATVVGQFDDDVRALAARCFADPEAFDRRVREMYAAPHATANDELVLVEPRHAALERWTGPIVDRHGEPAGRIWSFRDVTAERRMAREREDYAARVEASNAALARASRAKDAFLANLSHELRTPLNVVIGYVKLVLEGGLSPAEERDFLERSAASAAHLLRLISDMLDLTRLEAGTVEMTVEPLPVRDVVEEVRSLTEVLAEAKGLDLGAVADPFVHVLADRQRLKQVLLNLVGNALKFTAAGRVSITAAACGDDVEFKVRDTGRGIAHEQQTLLFQKFMQVHEHPTSAEDGVGLGLSICRELVTLMGGTIALTSDGPGCGTVVRFTLPRTGPETPARIVAARAAAPAPSHSHSIVAGGFDETS